MTKQQARDEFIGRFTAEVVAAGLVHGPHNATDGARRLLRLAATIHRLAEAQCNGDYPYEHGSDGDTKQYRTCTECEGVWYKSAIRKDGRCVDCHAGERAKALAAEYGYVAYVQGDPRGYVLTLHPAGTAHDDMDSGRSRGLGVPS